jgi:hypothetical protein
MFVTLKVFKLIGPSNDGRRHGRGTYLFIYDLFSNYELKNAMHWRVQRDVALLSFLHYLLHSV